MAHGFGLVGRCFTPPTSPIGGQNLSRDRGDGRPTKSGEKTGLIAIVTDGAHGTAFLGDAASFLLLGAGRLMADVTFSIGSDGKVILGKSMTKVTMDTGGIHIIFSNNVGLCSKGQFSHIFEFN